MVWGIWNSLIEGVMDEWNICISDAVGVKQTRGKPVLLVHGLCMYGI